MDHRITRATPRLAFASFLLFACADAPQTILSPEEAPPNAAAANLSAWSPATPIAEINTADAEGCPFLAKHDDALYFTRHGDLHVSHWDAAAQGWGEPMNLGPGVNTADNESCAVVLNSGKELIFYSNRPGGAGSFDLWSVTRRDHRDDLGWGSPVNLGALNSSAAEFGHGVYEEEDGSTVLYFNSAREPGTGQDIYMSARPEGGTFSAPTLVAELNSPATDRDVRLSKDGLEIFFVSDRGSPPGSLDIWTATRERTSDPWGSPVKLDANINSAAIDAVPTLSWDGMTLIFVSFRAGNPDLYQSTRTRERGRATQLP
jgi:hypothetical protein